MKLHSEFAPIRAALVALVPLIAVAVALGITATALAQQRGRTAKKPPRPAAAGPAALDVQVLLDRAFFSSGQIDGRPGRNTRLAVSALQQSKGLPATGVIDAATREALGPPPPEGTVMAYTITAEDVAGPFLERIPKELPDQAKLKALGYTSALEALAEKFHSAPALLTQLNPSARFAAGEQIRVPNVIGEPPPPPPGNLAIVVTKSTSSLHVTTPEGRIVFHAPVTTGSAHDPLPLGNWKVTGIARNPTFHYNPDLFWDADPSHAKAKIPPGPNNPVGLVWIDLDRPHYGLHGTPEPSRIGYTQSHGCVRLTNWDVVRLAAIAKPGMPVLFQQ